MTRFLSSVLIAVSLIGCTQRPTIGHSNVQPNPMPRLARDIHVRMNELSTMLDQFDADLRELPGQTEADNRRSVAKLFGNLAEILPTLFGPNPTGSYRQQIRIIDTARAQLAGQSPFLSDEPTIDTGLRAACNALSSLQRDQFYNHAEIAKSLTDLRVILDTLDTVRGPLHRSSVQDAMTQISKVLHQMSDVLNSRLANRA